MAVVSRDKNTNTNNSKDGKEEVKKEAQVVDFDKLDSLPQGQVSAINKDADAWERLAPPPCPKGNRYQLKLFPAKDGAKRREAEEGNPSTSYYTYDIEGKLINTKDEEFDGVTVYCSGLHNLSTRIPKRRDISTMMGLIVKLGIKDQIKEKMSDLDQLKLFNKVLKSEPVIWVELDWEAFSKNDKDRNGFSKKIFATYEDFPLVDSETGERRSEISITNEDGGKETINARLFVREWIGTSNTGGNAAGGGGTNNSNKRGGGVVENVGDDEDEDSSKKVSNKGELDIEEE